MSQSQRTFGQSDIAKQILAHLAEHPKAQDTLEGILHWWLLEQQIKLWKTKVHEALLELVAQGMVSESKGHDGRIHYRVSRRKAAQIRALLKQSNEEEAQPERNHITEKDS